MQSYYMHEFRSYGNVLRITTVERYIWSKVFRFREKRSWSLLERQAFRSHCLACQYRVQTRILVKEMSFSTFGSTKALLWTEYFSFLLYPCCLLFFFFFFYVFLLAYKLKTDVGMLKWLWKLEVRQVTTCRTIFFSLLIVYEKGALFK